MADIVQADIFFFITTIAVIVVGIGLVIFLYYAITITQDIRFIVKKVRKLSDEFEKDFVDMRAQIKSEGLRIGTIFNFISRFFKSKSSKSRANKKESERDGE